MIAPDSFCIAFPGRDALVHGLSSSFYQNFQSFRNIFDIAGNSLNEDIYELSYQNTDVKPEFQTICLITHCYALYTVLTESFTFPDAVAGFSHGEFTSIAASGSVKFPDVLKMIYQLESILLETPQIRDGKMVRVYEFETGKLEECIHELDPCKEKISIATYFNEQHNIVSGETSLINQLAEMVKKQGARWVIPLSNQGAFHSPLCYSVLHDSNKIFHEYHFENTRIPVYSCANGLSSCNGSSIRQNISVQIAKPILWNTIVNNLSNNHIKTLLELGPGSTLSGNSRIINPEFNCIWINNIEDFERYFSMSLA